MASKVFLAFIDFTHCIAEVLDTKVHKGSRKPFFLSVMTMPENSLLAFFGLSWPIQELIAIL